MICLRRVLQSLRLFVGGLENSNLALLKGEIAEQLICNLVCRFYQSIGDGKGLLRIEVNGSAYANSERQSTGSIVNRHENSVFWDVHSEILTDRPCKHNGQFVLAHAGGNA